ncbi:GAF domain-containing sensor histidine kinase [Deinococcus irradiatisoli]|uniref:GAF domain-containing sensor histidine kinase n=1 Tax=Deinococcus irradiatisoli TaxID=2202254 RepID=UPI001FE85BC8|nr:GAF domain-containing sensor histidine kinase [Deinococcus irradiatisoli]
MSLPPAASSPGLEHHPGQPLSRTVLLTRNVLPLLIALVVIAYEELFIPLGDASFGHLAHLAFYGLAGPLVTFFTIQWIAEGVQAREQAEQELRRLYAELSASHERMSALQHLMREVSEPADLETLLEVAVSGAQAATGAASVQARLRGNGYSSAEHPQARRSEGLSRQLGEPGRYQVSEALRAGGEALGELSLSFAEPPSSDTRELIQAIGSELSSAVISTQRRTRDLITLFEVDQSIRAERNMQRLLARVTGNIAGRVQATARAAFLTDQDGLLRLEYARDPGGEIRSGGALPAFVRRVAELGQPGVASPQEAAEVFPGVRAALGLPMHGEGGLVGVIVLGGEGPFEKERAPLLALLASQATLAVRNARAYLYSEELAIGEERNRIAREIHDGVAQSLAFCAIKLDVVARQIPNSPEQAVLGVQEAGALLREQIREVRRSIFALRPIDLERYGLLETVRRYVLDFGEQHSVKVQLDIGGDIHLAPGDEAVVFRILQESLNNVAKHARAGSVTVRLTGNHSVKLAVEDDGQGFDLSQVSGRVSSAGGLGLTQMRERIESRGGSYRVESEPGRGTRIEARLPQG